MAQEVFPAGSTGRNVTIKMRSNTTGQFVDVSHSDVTAKAVLNGGTPAAVAVVSGTLGIFASESWVGTGTTGEHQFSVKNTLLAAAGTLVLTFSAPGCIDREFRILITDAVRGLGAPTALPPAAAGANGGLPLGDGSGRVTLVDKTGFALTSAYDPAKTAAQAGDAMTLTSGERTAVANEVEAQIIDDTDSEKVLKAITDKIAAANPDLSGLTVGAIASAVWSATERTLSAFGFTVSTSPVTLAAAQPNYAPLKAGDYVAPNNAGIGTAAAAAAAALVAAEAAQDAALAAQAAAAAAATPGDVAVLLNTLKGAGWTTETLKAIFDKPGAALSAEQLADIAAAVIEAINTDGVSVASLLTAALTQIRGAVEGATVRVVGPLAPDGKRLRMVRGDDYAAGNGQSLTFEIENAPGLVGSKAVLRLAGLTGDACESATITDATQVVVMGDLLAEKTNLLTVSDTQQDYQIRFVKGGLLATVIKGKMVVEAQV